jgi:hypothetical protein
LERVTGLAGLVERLASTVGPVAIGLIESVSGAAVGGSLIAVAVQRMRRRVVYFTGFLVVGAPRFLILAFDVPMWAVLAVFAVAGCGGGFLNPILGAVSLSRARPTSPPTRRDFETHGDEQHFHRHDLR